MGAVKKRRVPAAGMAQAEQPPRPEFVGEPLQGAERQRAPRAERPDPAQIMHGVEVAQIDHAGAEQRDPAVEQPQRHAHPMPRPTEGQDHRLGALTPDDLHILAPAVLEHRRVRRIGRQHVQQLEDVGGPFELRLALEHAGERVAGRVEFALGKQPVHGVHPGSELGKGELRRPALGEVAQSPSQDLLGGGSEASVRSPPKP